MGRIETTLQFSRGQVGQWNNGLMNQVQPAVEKRMGTIQRNQSMSLGYQRTAPPTESVQASSGAARHTTTRQTTKLDVFLSHASEDKDAIARPLYEELTAAGVTVWFDEAVLRG